MLSQGYSSRGPPRGSLTTKPASKRPRTENNNPGASGSRFSLLSDDDEGNKIPDTGDNKKVNTLYPPITVLKSTITEIKQLINTKAIKFFVKITGVGLRVQCLSYIDHHNCLKLLKEKNVEYYTFQTPEDRPLKFVLSGLPKMEVEELKTLLVEKGLTTITEINLMKSKYESINQAKYLIKFKRNSININILRTIRAVDYIIVTWEHYRKKNK